MPAAAQPIFDGHHDALTREDHAGLVTGRDGGHLDLPRAARGGLVASMWAIFCHGEDTNLDFTAQPGGGYDIPLDPEVPHATAAAEATAYAGRLLALERAGHLRVARGVADLDAAADGSGPPAAVMHLEGAEPIDTTLEALDAWHAMGLRSVGPVWSRPNRFGHGVPFRFPSSPDTGEGLTAAGRALVAKCEALKIAVDVSHLNARGFWDVAELTGRPVIATHCGAHAVAPASRNLTDEQLDAIGNSNGIVGIPYIVDFLRPDGDMNPDTPLTTVVAHVRHVADRIGVDHVGFGSDFDGGVIPEAIGDAAGLPGLLAALADDGFTPEEIAKIAWGNWRRVLAAAWA
ncbi:MAG TPA: dipeptidase [Baekduia sp.]|uniref:dipeptidase n=1 Tax=Baekduia sp. TaxID=2600305 RepID=UPI002D765578|nr:dipeptidase [Baekduia sp.]HET6508178.1 dipeptidase [Baekduia sp.]